MMISFFKQTKEIWQNCVVLTYIILLRNAKEWNSCLVGIIYVKDLDGLRRSYESRVGFADASH